MAKIQLWGYRSRCSPKSFRAAFSLIAGFIKAFIHVAQEETLDCTAPDGSAPLT